MSNESRHPHRMSSLHEALPFEFILEQDSTTDSALVFRQFRPQHNEVLQMDNLYLINYPQYPFLLFLLTASLKHRVSFKMRTIHMLNILLSSMELLNIEDPILSIPIKRALTSKLGFLNFAPELRNRIYKYLSLFDDGVSLSKVPWIDLLAACKQIQNECPSILYGGTFYPAMPTSSYPLIIECCSLENFLEHARFEVNRTF
ncbi:hypothetical protein K432DRAFT_391899 [Lepidopterella palustris CBS 459.81]|uniref:Uncharacterized protein n=1 Tax=Lepidopterella palustris CBS 459.81 TaxID=1314670 RepID=A0A8E2EDF4_9PEZI|nr:hypothetical protein K432DRAFT_391899 [Lepidopterella palustris CBS 459.81]